jgi:sodium/hydrogen exchanger 3
MYLFLQQASAAAGTDDVADDPLSNLDSLARNVLLLVSLLALTLVINNFLEKRHAPIPEAIVTVTIGIVAGAVASLLPFMKGNTIEKLEDESASEFMVAFIAPIIFAEGYGLKSREFFDNLTRILMHAFVGTLLSSIVVAVGIFYLPPLTGFSAKFSFAECLSFGALISATDPVTTLAIFKEQNMVENGLSYLYYTVLGESILNDAVAITLFESFSDLVKDDVTMDVGSVGTIAGKFCITFIGSVCIGVLSGLFTALVLKFARLGSGASEEENFYFNVPEIGVALVLAYLPFLVAEAAGLSGIVAVMFAGISMRHYAHYNMTLITRQVYLPIIELLANLSETYVFLLLGLGVFLLKNNYSLSFILWVAVFCLIGRAIHVYPFSWVVNRCSSAHDLSINEQHIVWYAGLRGAIAFICALCFPMNARTQPEQHRGIVLCTTVIFVLCTMLVFGWPTTQVLRLLDIRARDLPMANTATPAGPDAGIEAGGLEETPRLSCWAGTKSTIDKHGKDFSRGLKRVLMTSTAVVEKDANSQAASEIRSMRASGALSQPRQSGVPPSTAVGSEAPRDSAASSAPFTFGQNPNAPGYGRPSAPMLGARPSAALSDQVLQNALAGRPSAPPRLQCGSGADPSMRSFRSRMLCNP